MGRAVKDTAAAGKTFMELVNAGGMKPLPLLLTLSLPALALAAPGQSEVRSYVNVGGKVQSVFAWCDAPEAVIALTELRWPGPNEDGLPWGKLLTWSKTRTGLSGLTQFNVALGGTHPSAGRVLHPLFWNDGATAVKGHLRLDKARDLQAPTSRMTHVNEFRLGNKTYTCRSLPQAAFIGVTRRRTVIVWDNGKTVTYATRNFDRTPGAYITGGNPINFGSESGWGYEFQTKDGLRYSVAEGDFVPKPEMHLSVIQGNKGLLYEPFLAYSISTPTPLKEQP